MGVRFLQDGQKFRKMALQSPGAFFLGTLVPSEQKFLKQILVNAKKAGYNRFIEPCAGAFAMSHLAVQSGFKPEEIEASDVIMFSSIFGYAIMGEPLDDLELKSGIFSKKELKDPATALYALMVLKTMCQSGGDFFYTMLKDLEARRKEHIAKIQEQLDRAQSILHGFRYRALDMYDHLDEVMNDPKAIIFANPPTYKAGFEKWYDTRGNMTWKEPEYKIFDPEDGLIELMQERMKGKKALILCYEENTPGMMAGYPVFARYGVRKGVNVYLTTNNPEKALELSDGKTIARPEERDFEPLDCTVVPSNYEITETSRIQFERIEPQNALYYRSVWTHNYVGGQAQINVGMFIDGFIAGVFGYQIAFGKELKEIVIMYGMTTKHDILRMNRLLTMIAVNRETLRSLIPEYMLFKYTGIQTTQMTKYPESKEMRGIMKLKRKEQGKLGYKLVYRCDIQERTAQETLNEFLKREDTWRRERQKTKS